MLKYPPVLSKFRPADVDPNIDYSYSPKDRSLNIVHGEIPKALEVLGIPPNVARGKNRKGKKGGEKRIGATLWEMPDEFLWNLLELAKIRYGYEIACAHPDRGGNLNRAIQLNKAWAFVKSSFKKRGFELG